MMLIQTLAQIQIAHREWQIQVIQLRFNGSGRKILEADAPSSLCR